MKILFLIFISISINAQSLLTLYNETSTATPDTSFALNDSTGFAADSVDFGQDTSKTWNVTASNVTWAVDLTDSTEASVSSTSNSFTATFTPTTAGAYTDSVKLTTSLLDTLYLGITGTGVDTASAAETNILEDSSFVYGYYSAPNAVWWSGTWTHNSGTHSISYSGSGTATITQTPAYGSTWSIEVADPDNFEVGFEVANAATGLALMIDLYEADWTNRQNTLGSTFTYYNKANGVHWVDFSRTTKADKVVISATSTGGAGDILWIKIRPK